MKTDFVETVIGATVIAVAVIFFTYAYRTAEVGAASGGYSIDARFERIDGISTGSDVRMSGIKIGTVVAQKLDPVSFEAIVTMTVSPDIKLPDDSTAKITSEGLLGGNYISLEAGGSEKNFASGDEITNTQSSVDLLSLLGQAIFSAKSS